MKIQLSIPIVAGALLLSACGGEDASKKDQPKVEVTVEDASVSADDDFMLPQPISLAY
ncbi:MAG: hypothetical protein HYZ43_02250 [Flavobacteriia bacterium]|nr:hypothetical protein [Flavobacteriia bacterium]